MHCAKTVTVCRIIAHMLVLSLLLGITPVFGTILEPLQAVMSMTVDGQATRGETVQMVIRLDENPGAASLMINVEYDDTRLMIESHTDVFRHDVNRDMALFWLTGTFPQAGQQNRNPLRVLWHGASNDPTVGVLLTIDFTVRDYAPPGEANIRAWANRGDFGAIVPGSAHNRRIEVEEVSGTVTIVGETPQITITANATDGGSASGGGDFAPGDTVQLTATPNSGYVFVGWYDGNTRSSEDAVYSFDAVASRTIEARFQPDGVPIPSPEPSPEPSPSPEPAPSPEPSPAPADPSPSPTPDGENEENGEENGNLTEETTPHHGGPIQHFQPEPASPNDATGVNWQSVTPEAVASEELSPEIQVMAEDNEVFMVEAETRERVLMSMPHTRRDDTIIQALVARMIRANEEPAIIIPSFFDAATNQMRLIGYTGEMYIVSPNLVTFADVLPGAWYHGAVTFVAARELFAGVGNNMYAPGSMMTRAMFVSVLSRLDGINPAGFTASPFNDVSIGAWYGPAIAWANAQGIINEGLLQGLPSGEFHPNANITREEMAVIFANYLAIRDFPLVQRSVPQFYDLNEANPWARVAIQEMRQHAIISGVGGNLYHPQSFATRAEVAQIYMNLVQAIVGLS